ncbi:Carbohydrate-binding CenC domain protein [Desulfatibacillum aliphaticivorans]|uniref:Carbohydrate-binding CenC domain protein n=1 Tax=Desulfatibacillum aliphaticivorans TaxID=218208 RepID=B8FCQ8_DESAL|nr:carbohydrate binding domain-containing protein [Desulfatibacillum aliphaticivorans]ACL06221.1 Carbohydrate-binding CenC domain protein [Desulfatibacillum aliphaticivorans]
MAFKKFRSFNRFTSFNHKNSVVRRTNFSSGIPSYLSSANLTDNGDGTVSGNPSFYSPELVTNGDFSATSLGAEQASGNLAPGHYYEITAHDGADFTADGAADNNVGTRFIAADTNVTLGAGDKVKEISWDDWTVNNQDADNYFVPGAPDGLRMVSTGSVVLAFWQTMSVSSGSVQKLSVNCGINEGSVRLRIGDITNSANILELTNMDWATGTNDYYFVVPDDCTTIRIYFYRYDSGPTDITYHSISVTQCSLDATNLISNGGFETPGAGGADVFASWGEHPNDGLVEQDATPHYGTYAAKLTGASGSVWVQQNAAVVEFDTYVLSFWTRGDGINQGSYFILDLNSSEYIVTPTQTGVAGTTYTKYTKIFSVHAGCENLRLYLFSPSGATKYCYFDDVSLRRVLPGKELLADPDFDDAGAWTIGTGWSVADGVASMVSDTGGIVSSGNIIPSYSLCQVAVNIDSVTAGVIVPSVAGQNIAIAISAGLYTGKTVPIASAGAFTLWGIEFFRGGADYASVKKLTLSTTTSTLRLPGARRIKAGVTASGSEWVGVVMAQDSQTSPANFVVAFIDSGDTDDFKAYKVVAGVWTSLIDTNVTYAAGAEVEIRRNGDVFSFYYNGAQVGTNQTVAGMTGAYCGLFATGAESTFTDLEVR